MMQFVSRVALTLGCSGQQRSREIGAECLGREAKNQGGPHKGYSPPAHDDWLCEVTFHVYPVPGPL
jgi:hypothetical protein